MLVREFDMSVAGMVESRRHDRCPDGRLRSVAGRRRRGRLPACVGGVLQGLIMTRLRLSSVGGHVGRPADLSGYHLRAHRRPVDRLSRICMWRCGSTRRFGASVSVRSVVALGVFVLAAVVMGYTPIGRDVYATGNDRRASRVAGVNTNRVIIGVFAASGGLSALAGVLFELGLGAASPVALADMLAPAAAAAIIGGVSLVGGRGRPMGIAAGVLILVHLALGPQRHRRHAARP